MMDYKTINRLNWNDRTAIHAKSEYYNVDALLAGENELPQLDRTELGDVSGRSMLHLQCHFGKDSLSWAMLGADVTGVDLSEKAIQLAKRLNDKLGLNARFICSDIYDAKDELQGERFDIVYTSYGVLCWLPDLTKWAELVSSSLKQGGVFYMTELHPFSFIYEVDDNELKISYPYFDNEVIVVESDITYTGDKDKLEHATSYQWQHTLGDIISALAGAGLVIEFVHEFPYTSFNMFPGLMVQDEQGRWRMKDNDHLPLLFSIKATKR